MAHQLKFSNPRGSPCPEGSRSSAWLSQFCWFHSNSTRMNRQIMVPINPRAHHFSIFFPWKWPANQYGVSTPRSATAPVVPLLPASSALLRAPELPGPSRNVQGTCLRRRRAEKMGDTLNMSIWLGKYEKFMITGKLWRNLKNLSQKQLAFVKESCSTGLRWTSVGEAWDLDHWHR